MPFIEIKTWNDGQVLYAGEHDTLKEAVEAAVKAGAYLAGANLTGAYLAGAYLRGAYLRDANLAKITLAYQSHDLLAEVLKLAAGDDTEKLKIAGYILISREKCWDDFAKLAAVDPLGDWALNELARWVQPDDGAPGVLRKRAEKLATA